MAGRYHGAPCAAWARSVQRPCIRRPVLNADGRPKNGRCPSHGGLSTGAKTPKGKARQTAGRLAYYAARRAAGLPVLPRAAAAPPRAQKTNRQGFLPLISLAYFSDKLSDKLSAILATISAVIRYRRSPPVSRSRPCTIPRGPVMPLSKSRKATLASSRSVISAWRKAN